MYFVYQFYLGSRLGYSVCLTKLLLSPSLLFVIYNSYIKSIRSSPKGNSSSILPLSSLSVALHFLFSFISIPRWFRNFSFPIIYNLTLQATAYISIHPLGEFDSRCLVIYSSVRASLLYRGGACKLNLTNIQIRILQDFYVARAVAVVISFFIIRFSFILSVIRPSDYYI